VFTIKHLREASQTDGKAARNLEKLSLFRQVGCCCCCCCPC